MISRAGRASLLAAVMLAPKQLACIAEKTGGEYRGAKDAPALKEALGGLAQNIEAQSGLGQPTVGEGGASLRPLSEKTQGNVKMLAVRTPGGVPIKTVWRIWDPEKTKTLAHADQRTEASFSLPPGKYRLVAGASNAQGGNARADLPFEVGARENNVLELAYNSGRVMFATFEFEGGPAVSSVFRVRPEGTRDLAGAADYRPRPDFELQAGKYQLKIELGNAVASRTFDVQPGSDRSENIALNIGRVTLRAVPKPGGQAIRETHWRLFSIAADGTVGARAGTEDYRAAPKFILAQGNYVARVEIDGGKKGERRFSVKAGQGTSEEVVVGP